jgi:hypothetical protein
VPQTVNDDLEETNTRTDKALRKPSSALADRSEIVTGNGWHLTVGG